MNMFPRYVLRSAVLSVRQASSSTGTTALITYLPFQRRTLHREGISAPPSEPPGIAAHRNSPPRSQARSPVSVIAADGTRITSHSKQPLQPTHTTPPKVTRSLLKALPYLTTQGPHFMTAHLHARPYLITAGDHVRLPFRMPNVVPGDVLRFNRATALGSRDFTLKGTPYIDERLFECRVRVLGVDSEPMRIKEKTKRRQRHVRTVRSKHRYTLLRVMDVKMKTASEILAMGAEVIEDEIAGASTDAVARLQIR